MISVVPYIHEKAICESKNIGDGTQILAYAHILPGAKIGANCNICDYVFIENQVSIGNNVTVKCGVQLWDNTYIEDDVFIGPNATFTNHRLPISKKCPEEVFATHVKQGASIGANATILPGLIIGQKSIIGAGSVVTKNVPPHAIVAGNPARIIGYNEVENYKKTNKLTQSAVNVELQNMRVQNTISDLPVKNCSLRSLPLFNDLRGSLMVNQFHQNMPFVPKRSFFVYNVPTNKVRGEHAHKVCDQFLIAIHGSLAVILDDSENKVEVELSSPAHGLYVPAKVWGIQYKFSADAILCVFASHDYHADDYIRDYSEFIQYIKAQV